MEEKIFDKKIVICEILGRLAFWKIFVVFTSIFVYKIKKYKVFHTITTQETIHFSNRRH